MPLTLVRSRSNGVLWATCAERFLAELGDHAGPAGYPTHLWIAHRNQRDALFELAAERGLAGWLRPPVSFFSALRQLFAIEEKPVGILTGRMLVARLAGRFGIQSGVAPGHGYRGPAGSHMLDRVFSELLPDGVTAARLKETLDQLGGDDFARRRNAWIADTYEAFLEELRARSLYDPRSIHAMVAERIEAGGLDDAIGGASRLHVYGITSLRSRGRLFRAIAEQAAVDVALYLPHEEEASEWEALATGGCEEAEPVIRAGGDAVTASQQGDHVSEALPRVQPTPDAVREAAWIASCVKRLLAEGAAEPHQVAVVARSGRHDTRIIHSALEAAGVPATSRLRSVLAEIPSLKALLQLLRAEADGWGYAGLRQVLSSPYFGVGIDLRAIDFLAAERRFQGLQAWEAALVRLRERLETDDGWRLNRKGVYADRLDADLPRFRRFRETVDGLSGSRPEREWIDLTVRLLSGEGFDFRRRLCEAVADRYDIVRLDQRGVLHVESLLREWSDLVSDQEPMPAAAWQARLGRLLEANDLALSTPLKEGVQVLEAHEAALTPFRYSFVVHANDGVFPRSHSAQGVFSDDERCRLRELGLPLTHREEALRRERALWRAVTQNDRVVITYRTTDAAGIPRLPSLMVPEHDPATELPRTLDAAALEAQASDPDLRPANPAQHRRREVQRLARLRHSGDTGVFETPEPEVQRHAVLTAFAEELRSGHLDAFVRSERDLIRGASGTGLSTPPDQPEPDAAALFGLARPISERPTAWNGKLRDPVVLAELERKFHDRYTWSASQLEAYGKRPFDFLLGRVLYLEEVVEADEETSPLAFGNVAHSILEEFYRRVLADPPATFDAEAAAIYDAVIADVLGDAESDYDQWLGLPTLWAVTRDRVTEQVRRYLEWELDYLAEKKEIPQEVELRFGGDDRPEVRIRGLDLADRDATLLLRGRIDRVDRYGKKGKDVLRVLDYKSSTGTLPKKQGYLDGALLQTALYMKAADVLTPISSSGARSSPRFGSPSASRRA
jgi:hypothetical protein